MIDGASSETEVGAENAADIAKGSETLASFLAELGKALKDIEGVDSELADILADHLLVSEPTSNAVVSAQGAIVALAERRADTSEEEFAND